MRNSQIADNFALLAQLMDIHGENSFRSKSYSIAAYNIERLPREIAEMSEPELFAMKGIGESTGRKILQVMQTGQLDALEDIIGRTPQGILQMLQIKGLGPKKIAVIWKEMGIESVGELEYACNENRLVSLKGFGQKTQASILQNIAYSRQNEGFYLWAEAARLADDLLTTLQKAIGTHRITIAGQVRRQLDVVSGIEMITDAPATLIQQVCNSIEGAVVSPAADGGLAIQLPYYPGITIACVGQDDFAVKLFASTGSEAFNEAFGNQYKIPATAVTEDEIFIGNGLQMMPPCLREDATWLTKAANGQLPELIQPGDIKGIIHSHSHWSDGMNTIEQMATAAIAQGFEYLVLSDHSQSAFYAGGLKPDRIAAQHQEIDALNEKLAPFKIFKSIEADILNDGSLDYDDSVLSTFDLVIASVHSNLKMSQEKAMHRVLGAIMNPYTTIMGHLTGRLLLSRPGYPVDHKTIIDACAEYKVVLEINAHPRRLDMDWSWIQYAIEKGVLLSIDPDAHSIDGFSDVKYGVLAAQKGGLTANANLSSFTLTRFEAFLQHHKKR